MTVSYNDIWIPTEDAAIAMQVTPRAVVKSKRLWRYRPAESGIGFEFCLASLPHDAVVRYQIANLPDIPEVSVVKEDTEAYANMYAKASNRSKNHADKWSLILSRCEGIMGRSELDRWTTTWNEAHPEMAVSTPSIYRMRAQVADFGRISLLSQSRVVGSTVTDELWEVFKWAFLRPSAPSVPVAREIAIGKCIQDGIISDSDQFPSVHAFQRRVNRELDDAVLAYARKGKKRYNDAHGVYIEREYNMPAGSVWVGDTRTWDVFVQVEGQEKPSTCYMTLFLDMRTYMPMGWHIHLSAPSTDNVLRSIRNGTERYGLCDEVYLDNGREFRNKDFSGQTRGRKIIEDEQKAESLLSRLNIRAHFAKVKRAQSKIIERNFLVIKGNFDKLFNSYKGGNVLEKPEILKDVIKRGKVMPWEEFKKLANQFMEETFPMLVCEGKNHNGASRLEKWNELIAQRQPMRRVSQETASMLTTRTATGTIRRQGFRLVELDCWFWAEWMPVSQGRSVTLRYDPDDLRIAWCYAEDGSLLGEAMLWQAVDAIVSHSDVIGKERIAAGIKRTKTAEKLIRSLVPDATRDEARAMLDSRSVYLGKGQINIPSGQVQITRHDHDAKALSTDKKIGKTDLGQFVKNTDESPVLIAWPDEIPLSKQA